MRCGPIRGRIFSVSRYEESRSAQVDAGRFNEGRIAYEGRPRRGTVTLDDAIAGLPAR